MAAQRVHPTYFEQIERSANQAIYATASGKISYATYTVSVTQIIYTPASGEHYSGNTIAISQVANDLSQGTTAGQLLAQENGAYLTQQDVDPDTSNTIIAAQRASPPTARADAGGVAYVVPENATTNRSSPDGDGHPKVPHIIRISPDTVQWLMQNYEVAEGASLPLSTLYNHYLRHYKGNKLCHVNAASFGNIIRSAFPGVRARKLGTKGNSKYYFYGIRVIPGSSLNQLSGNRNSAVRQQPSSKKRYKFLPGSGESENGTQKIDSQYKKNTNHSFSQL
jgi:regulatory factor X 1/2/3